MCPSSRWLPPSPLAFRMHCSHGPHSCQPPRLPRPVWRHLVPLLPPPSRHHAVIAMRAVLLDAQRSLVDIVARTQAALNADTFAAFYARGLRLRVAELKVRTARQRAILRSCVTTGEVATGGAVAAGALAGAAGGRGVGAGAGPGDSVSVDVGVDVGVVAKTCRQTPPVASGSMLVPAPRAECCRTMFKLRPPRPCSACMAGCR